MVDSPQELRCMGSFFFLFLLFVCLFAGVPLLAVAYGREFARRFYTDSNGWQSGGPVAL